MEYLVRYSVTTLASLIPRDKQQQFGYGLAEINDRTIAYDRVIPHDGQYFHQGIGIDTIVEADSFDEATEAAEQWVIPLFDLISFVANTEISMPEQQMVINYSDESGTNGFRNVVTPEATEPTIGKVRAVDGEVLSSVHERIYSDEFSQKDRRKLIRGLNRYSSALHQQSMTDQFTWFYIALDAIEHLLQQKYDLKGIREFPCKECDAVSTAPDNTAGIRHFVEECDEISVDYSELSDTRNSVFHGGSISDAPEQAEDVMRVFRYALLAILGINSDEHREMVEQDVNGHLKEERLVVTGQMKGYDPIDIARFTDHHSVEVESRNVSYEIVGEKLRRKPETSIKIDTRSDATIESYAMSERYIGNVTTPDINNIELGGDLE